jgi:uncharacterized protein YjbI with pentapeptide repeats
VTRARCQPPYPPEPADEPSSLPAPGARVPGLRLADRELVGCDLANVVARGGALRRVVLRTARLTGLVWSEGDVQDVVFRDCRIDLASFAGTRLLRVVFEGCLLRETDFQAASLQSVRFQDCDLSDVDLAGARLSRCELRGCVLEGLRGVERLRGAAMPWPDIVGAAGTFAAALGIGVLDEPD